MLFRSLAESSMTAMAYGYAGLFNLSSMALIPWIVPSIMAGVPIGGFLIRRIQPDTFRRVCMSFDAWIVAFGLSRLLKELHLVSSDAAYLLLAGIILIDGVMLYRFFARARAAALAATGTLV